MKDLIQKLTDLQEEALSRKILTEEGSTPAKPETLKDVFESIAGMKPIPVVGKEGSSQETGAGFINVTDPALQNLGRTIGDLAAQKKLQIVVPTATQTMGTVKPTATPGGQGQAMGAGKTMAEQEGQPSELSSDLLGIAENSAPPGSQEHMLELINKYHDLKEAEYKAYMERGTRTDSETGEYTPGGYDWYKDRGRKFTRQMEAIEKEFKQHFPEEYQEYEYFSDLVDDKLGLRESSIQEAKIKPGSQEHMLKLLNKYADLRDAEHNAYLDRGTVEYTRTPAGRKSRKYDWSSDKGDKFSRQLNAIENEFKTYFPEEYQEYEYFSDLVDDKLGLYENMNESKLDEKFASQQQAKLMYAAAGDKDVSKKTGVSQKVAKEFIKKSHGQKVSKLPKKVDEAHTGDEAENIAWATANKRGMLDNKNKKVTEGSGPKEKQKRPYVDYFSPENRAKAKAAADAEKAKFDQDKKAKAAEKIGKKKVNEAHTGDEAEKKFDKYNAKELDYMLDRAYGRSKPGDAHKQKRAGQAKNAAYNIMWRKKYGDLAEGDIPSSSGVDTRGAGLGAGRSMTTLEDVDPAVKEREVNKIIKKLERIGAADVHDPDALRRVAEFIFDKMRQGFSYNQALVLSHRINEGKLKKERLGEVSKAKLQKYDDAARRSIDDLRWASYGEYTGPDRDWEKTPDSEKAAKKLDSREKMLALAKAKKNKSGSTAPHYTPKATAKVRATNENEHVAEGKDEGKPGKNFAKIAKSAGERYGSKAAGERVAGAVRAKLAKQGKLEEAKPDFIDLDKDGDKKESMKKAMADKKKKKVNETMNNRIRAARHEGHSHGLRGHSHCGQNYDDMEEAKAYHEGYKEGLDECYGMGVYEGGMDEGNAFTGALARTPRGGKFSVGGRSFTDNSSLEEYAFGSRKQLGELSPDLLNRAADKAYDKGLDLDDGDSFRGKKIHPAAKEYWRQEEKFRKGARDAEYRDRKSSFDADIAKLSPAKQRRIAKQQQLDELSPATLKRTAAAARGRGQWSAAIGLRQDDERHKNLANHDFDLALKADAKANAKTGKDEYTPPTSYDWEKKGGWGMKNNPALKSKYRPATGDLPDQKSADAKLARRAGFYEDWDKQLKTLINEGVSVSISKGLENGHDSATVTATDADTEKLMALVKQAGLGVFGDEDQASDYGAPTDAMMHGGIEVVGDHDGMMGIMKKLAGVEMSGSSDYADEANSDATCSSCGCEDCECDDSEEEASCDGCGMQESKCQCDEEQVDEVETEDQMTAKVAEDESGQEEMGATEAEEDNALAKADAAEDEDELEESFTFEAINKKLAMLSKKSNEKDDKKAGKKSDKTKKLDEAVHPYNDFHHEAEKVLGGEAFSDGTVAFKTGSPQIEDLLNKYKDSTVAYTKNGYTHLKHSEDELEESLVEWANGIGGKGKDAEGKGTDASFERDIEFMTKTIAGGLNKPKSTGQTTIPVVAGQANRTEQPTDWAILAGIK